MKTRQLVGLLSVSVAMCLGAACGQEPADGAADAAIVGPGDPDAAAGLPDRVDAATSPSIDAARPDTRVAPGSSCSCDDDCEAVSGHSGICVYGVCMTRASAACEAAGSSGECGAGSRCWGLQNHEGSICWPDCDSYACDGTCDSDGSCVPESGSDCGYTCGSYCECEPGDCGAGMTCVAGSCVAETGDGPGVGPGPACPDLPPLLCTGSASYCGELITFSPRTTDAWDDYPLNGETAGNQYRSYLRRDLVMLIQYATAKVACKAAGWDTGNGGALGLGDMSEANGAIPGTAVGSPGHPSGTHTNGRDIDLAYYQLGTPDNRLRPICSHVAGGSDAYHCTATPHLLDVWRSALFLGAIFEHPNVRVVGADGKAGPLLVSALNTLCANGWVPATACDDIRLVYEETDMGWGWFHFHHHHMHVSMAVAGVAPANDHCMQPNACDPAPVKNLARGVAGAFAPR